MLRSGKLQPPPRVADASLYKTLREATLPQNAHLSKKRKPDARPSSATSASARPPAPKPKRRKTVKGGKATKGLAIRSRLTADKYMRALKVSDNTLVRYDEQAAEFFEWAKDFNVKTNNISQTDKALCRTSSICGKTVGPQSTPLMLCSATSVCMLFQTCQSVCC